MGEEEAKETKTMTAEEVKCFILNDQQDRRNSCGQGLVALLEKYNCELVPSITISGGQVSHSLTIVAKA